MEIKTTKIYTEIETAVRQGFSTISLQGSARSGKTYNIVLWLVLYAMKTPKIKISIVRGSLPALKGSVLEDFVEIMHRLERYKESRFNRTDLRYYFRGGSSIEFFSASDEQRLRGRKRDILFVNEANELTELQFQQLKMRTERLTIIDYNPSFSSDHWIPRIVNQDPRTYHFVSTYKDNPFLAPRIVEEIESLKTKNTSLWQVYGRGQMATLKGLIFQDFTIIETLPEHLKSFFIGTDFGYANDPTAIVAVSFDGHGLYLDEITYRTMMLQRNIIQVLKRFPGVKIISESADPRLVDEIHGAGINIHPVKKYPGSVKAGITWMLQHLIFVTSRSLNLIKELRSYTYAQDKDGKLLNVPIDSYNHAIDAVRYVCMEQFMRGNRRAVNLDRLEKIV